MQLPDASWLIVTTIGVLLLGAVIGWSMTHYRAWRSRRHSRPTD